MPIPTPGDLAAKAHRPLTARPAHAESARGRALRVALPAGAPFRQRFEHGLRRSELPRNARLLALTLATFGDWDTGAIPDDVCPGVPLMIQATGLSEGAVREALHYLKAGGWIERNDSGPGGHQAPPITLLIPASVGT
jgi:hypothetical protein